MVMVCQRCGAPLDVPEDAAMVRCSHCGVQVRLREPERQVRVAQRGEKRTPWALIALGIVFTMMASAGSIVFTLMAKPTVRVPVPPRPGAPAAAPEPEAPRGPTSFASSPRACSVDANGDGVSDALGFAGSPGSTNKLTLVDGARGAVLWQSDEQAAQTQLACLDPSWVVMVAPNFQAEFVHVRNLGAGVRVLLRDKLDEAGMGSGCARLRTDDGSTQGVQLPTGVATDCKAKTTRLYRAPDTIIGLTDERTQLRQGARTYTLSKRRSGTEMLTLAVAEGKKTLWSRELPYAAPTFSTGIVVADGNIVLWAAEPGARDRGMLIGLDEDTGAQRYTVPSTLLVANSLGNFVYNGRYVLVQAWNSLLAYEAASGKLAWKIGT